MSKPITDNHNDDGIDRRGFLQRMARPGTDTPAADHEPGPMKVEEATPKTVPGITNVESAGRNHSLAGVDSTLAPASQCKFCRAE